MILNVNDIAMALGVDGKFTEFTMVSDLMIDSRSVVDPERTLFVALSTSNNDGHFFIEALAERGVRNFVVNRIPESLAERGVRNFVVNRVPEALSTANGLNFIVVEDTLAALQRIGAFCRSRITAPVVAVTGSRGKTVVKEWLYQSLCGVARVSRSPRSFNSQIGVPLSLWQVADDAEVVVIEAGVSQAGEMARLAEIIRPDVSILTAITDEHAEGFADCAQKVAEKVQLLGGSRVVVYNADDSRVARVVKDACAGSKLVGVHAGANDKVDSNLVYVKAVLRELGYDAGLADGCYEIVTRLNVIDGVNNCRLIFDRFTADTLSLRGALDFLRRQVSQGMTRTLVISADGFVGSDDDIAKAAADYGVGRLIFAGKRKFEPSATVPSLKVVNVESVTALTTDDFYNEAVMIKGRPSAELDSLYAMLEAKQHETLMEVNLDAIVHNFNFFRSKVKPTTGVICMLKAHGYGAGSIELARTLQSQGAAYLAVAVVDEGVELRGSGITMPIMVLNPRAQNYRIMFDYRLEPEIYSLEMLDEIIAAAEKHGVKRFPVHLKLETGMRRLGFVKEDLTEVCRRLNATESICASTVFSHLACADDPSEDAYTRAQFDYFEECCAIIDSLLTTAPKRHILNSTGIVRFPEMQHDFVRLGIGLYGVKTLFDGSQDSIRNVSSLTSLIISLKRWPSGTTIGYNRRGKLLRDSVIATVPVGYADGIDRHLGYGNAQFIVNGHRCPTVGSICMDICMIDVTDLFPAATDGDVQTAEKQAERAAGCRVGNRVEIFGDNVSPIELADTLGTIPYEILTSISPRVKRVYYRE